MNYAQMEAGPEMDHLVGELVMGWRWVAKESDPGARLLNWPCWVDKEERVMWSTIRAPMFWSPSVYIAHAWQVVDRLHELGFYMQMGSHEPCDCWVEFTARADWTLTRHSAKHATAPLSICRASMAALMAVK